MRGFHNAPCFTGIVRQKHEDVYADLFTTVTSYNAIPMQAFKSLIA